MSTNNFPLVWNNGADDGLLGSLFPNKMNSNPDAIENIDNERLNPFASSPLSKNGTDLKNNFFLGSKLYNYGNIEIIVDSSSKQNPSDKIKIIEQNFIIESKGGNRQLDEGEKGFKVKLFICKDSNQLQTIFNDATIIPDTNEILLFLEDNSGDWSGTTMFIKKGSNVNNSNFFDKLFSKNSEFSSFINSNYSISKSDLQELLRKDKVESNALNLISSLFGAVSYLVSSPILIKSIAFGLETAIEAIKKNCSISEKSWNPANTEEGNAFQPLFFIGIPTILDNIDDSKINAYLKDAVKKLKTESNNYHEIIEKSLMLISKTPIAAVFPFPFNTLTLLPNDNSFSQMLLAKYRELRKTIDISIDELEKIDFTDIAKQSVYALNAFICGIWNGFVEAVCGIFSLVQYLFEGAGEIADLLENFKEKGPQLLEQIDNCILKFQELDFGQIFATLASNIKDWALSESTTSIVEMAYFSGMFIGFVIELVVELAIGILFTGGLLTIETLMAKLGETFKALGSLLMGAVKLPFKAAEKTVSSLAKGLKSLYEFLSKGTEEILKIIDEVFGKLKKVSADLANKFVDDVPNLSKSDLDWMAQAKPTKGNLGGSILKASQIRKLRGLLKEKGITLIIDGDLKSVKKLFKPLMGFENVDDLFRFMSSQNPPLVGGFDAITKQFILSKEATEIIVFHELSHLKHMEELGQSVYKSLSKLDKEMYVWKQILQKRKLWTDAEFLDSLNYINRIRVNEYGLSPLIIKL